MNTLTAWLLPIGLPDWAVFGIAWTLVVGGFGFAIGIGLAVDEWLRQLRMRRRWTLASEDAVLSPPPAYRDMRGPAPLPRDEELPALLRRQAE